MPYTPPAVAFTNNQNPVGGGVGSSIDAGFLNNVVSALVDHDGRVASLPVFVRDYVQPGVADATTGIAAAFAAATQVATIPDAYDGVTTRPKRRRVVFTAGRWNVTGTTTIPQGVDVEIQDDAYITATAAMGPILDTALNVTHQDGRITCRGTIDCNNFATIGIYVRTFAHYEIDTPRVYSPTDTGVILGDPTSTNVSYEGVVRSPYIWRPNAQAVPASSVGIWARYATDSAIGGPGSVVVGCKTGIRNDYGNNTFIGIHVWGYPPNTANSNSTLLMPAVTFLDNTEGGTYVDCYADSPTQYGWRFTADDPRAQLVGCRAYLTSSAADNTVTAVRVDSPTIGSVTSLGLSLRGATSTSRFAADFAGTTGQMVRVGTKGKNVATSLGDTTGGVNIGTLPIVTADTTLSPEQPGCIVDATVLVTVTVPAATAVPAGKLITIKNISSISGRIFVTPVSGVIDGRGSMELGPNDTMQIYSTGTVWYVASRSFGVAVAARLRAITSPPASGTAYQNLSGRTIYLSAAYTPTGAGTVQLELSDNGTAFTTFDNATFAAAGSTAYVKFTVPYQVYYRLTATAATLGAIVQTG